MEKEKYLIALTGPTSVGKTALSVQLALHLNTEILSFDSRQFYKEMKIGTAPPSEKALSLVPHHFIFHKSGISVAKMMPSSLSLLWPVSHYVVPDEKRKTITEGKNSACS